MAKNNKDGVKTAPVAPAAAEDELSNILDNQAISAEQSANVKALIEKETNEQKAREVKIRFEKAIYRIEEAVLQRRRDREYGDKVTLFKVRQMTRMARFLMGGVVDDKTLEYAQTPDTIWQRESVDKKAETITLVLNKESGEKKTFKKGEELPAIVDSVDFDMMYDELQKELRKRSDEVAKEHELRIKKLELRHGEYFDRSWRW